MKEQNDPSTDSRQTVGPAWPEITKVLESAVVVVLISALAYLLGYHYFESFFLRLSIPKYAANLASSEYMYWAFRISLLLAVTFVPAILVARKSPDTFTTALTGNLPILFAAALFGYSSLRQYDFEEALTAAVVMIGTLISSSFKFSAANLIYRSAMQVRLLVFVGVVFLALSLGEFLGNMHAEQLIEGSSNRSLRISLIFRQPVPELTDKQFMVVFADEKNYYLVERSNPPPRYPELFIIAKDQLSYARIDRMQ